MAGSGVRSTAEERRRDVVQAACVEFATRGLDGTSTEAVARRAGISQPYLFRLFPTKRALFIAAVEDTFDRVTARFRADADGLAGDAARHAMGQAYDDLLHSDPTVLRVQLHAYAVSSDDAEVRTATMRAYLRLWDAVIAMSGMTDEQCRAFFAHGMLCNVVAAFRLDLDGADPLAHRLLGPAGPPAYLEQLLSTSSG